MRLANKLMLMLGFGILLSLSAKAEPMLYLGDSKGAVNEFNCHGNVGSSCYVRVPDERSPQEAGPCYRVKVLSEMESSIKQVSSEYCESEK